MPRMVRWAGFLTIPLVSAITPLVALPAITSQYGSVGWASIAVGQATGMVGAATAELGWAWNGPMRAARSRGSARRHLLALAVITRALVALLVVPICGIAAFVVAPSDQIAAGSVAAGAALTGMSPMWYFIGTGRPWRGVLIDSLPRVTAASIAAIALYGGSGLWTYGLIAFALPSITTPLLALFSEKVSLSILTAFSFSRTLGVIRSQARIFIARTLSAGYMSVPVILLTAVTSVQQVAVFAAGDRVSRMVLSGMTSIPNSFQKWVGEPADLATRSKRALRAVGINIAVGMLAGLAVAALLPFASELLFSGTSTVSSRGAIALGLLVAIVATSRSVGGIALVISRSPGVLLFSTIAGLVVGVPSVLVGGTTWGAVGGFWGVVCAELTVLTVQCIGWALARKRT